MIECTPDSLPIIIYDQTRAHHITGQCDCDCCDGDCACDTSITNVPQQIDNLGDAFRLHQNLYVSSHTNRIDLDGNYAVYFGAVHPPVVLNQAAQKIVLHLEKSRVLSNLPADYFQVLRKSRIKKIVGTLISIGLISPDEIIQPQISDRPTTLSSWLHLTDRCNMRCSYCYLPHRRVDMTVETGKSVIDAIFRSALQHGYSRVKIKYAGGEPLLCFPTLVRIHEYARTLASQYSLGLDGIILSNGTLLSEFFIETMQDIGLGLMISMDGLGEYHDRQRSYAGGDSSSAHVRKAIELALYYGIRPDISITVTAHNTDGLPDLVSWILHHELPFNLNFYRENPLSISDTTIKFEEDNLIKAMLSLYQIIENKLPRYSLLASLVDRANLSHPHLTPCNVGKSYLVFDPRGNVVKCQMKIADTPITTYNDVDPLSTLSNNPTSVQNIQVESKELCSACEWRYFCGGGCPLLSYQHKGRYNTNSPYCNIYKALFPQVMRLEGMRLLKYGTVSDNS